jgi:hypothetical protein
MYVCIYVYIQVFPAMATDLTNSTLGLANGWLTVVLVSVYAVADTLGTLTGIPVFEFVATCVCSRCGSSRNR